MTSSERSRDEAGTIELTPAPAAVTTADTAPTPPAATSGSWPSRLWRDGSRRRRDWLAAIGVVALLTLLGLPLGALWNILAPRVEMVRLEGGWAFTQENPEQYMGDDGVFSLLGLAAGITVALTLYLGWRSRRGPLLLTAMVFGSVLCQTVAWRFGRAGREEYVAALDQVQVGWHTWRAPDLLMVDFRPFGTGEPGTIDTAWEAAVNGEFTAMWDHLSLGVLATMGFAVAFVYTVCAGWSKYASLRAERLPGETAD